MRTTVGRGRFERVWQRHSAPETASVHVQVSPDGTDVVANRAGWMALARWCMLNARRTRPDGSACRDPIDLGLPRSRGWSWREESSGLVLDPQESQDGSSSHDIRAWLYEKD